MLNERFPPGKSFDIDLSIEPFPYTRTNHNSRWSSGPDSQEKKYFAWRDAVRDAYDSLNFQVVEWGLPHSEPMAISGWCQVTENWEGKDLDNLIKSCTDSLNPTRRKDFKQLRTRHWVDDRKIVYH